MFRKLAVVIAALLFFAAPLAHADEASKRAKLDELFTVMKMNALMDQMMSSGMKQGEAVGKQMFGDKPMSAADQKIFDAYESKIATLMTNTLAWEKLKPAYVDLYAKTYSESEIDGILAFYKSPSGQAMVEKTPALLTASQAIVMSRVQDVQTQLQSISKDVMEQIAAAHKDDKPASQ